MNILKRTPSGYLAVHMAEIKIKPPLSALQDINRKNLTPVYLWNEKFRYECERQKTFEIWPLNWLNGNILAMTGMFYMGVEDRTRCFFCDVIIGKWEYEDDPVLEHLRLSPNCPLLGHRVTNNIPCNVEVLNKILPPINQSICDVKFPITSATKFKQNPDYSLENVRLATYQEWPSCMKQKPKQLAEAGFYYAGIGDRVICFSCDIGLKDWEPADDPWEQHAFWMSHCNYVGLVKGQTYIENVKKKFNKSLQKADTNNKLAVTPGPSAQPALEVDEKKLCKICFENECNTVYVPCGHVVCCTKCALCAQECPVCRSSISNVVRLYFS